MSLALVEWAKRACAPPGRDWLSSALAAITTPLDRSAWLASYARAGRRLGGAPLPLTPGQSAALCEAGGSLAWCLDELARAALLMAALRCIDAGGQATLVEEVFYRGDSRERQALLRGLGLLPARERFVVLAVEACRSNVGPVFAAIATDNPYPARYFPEPNFNQMVLKALFVELPVQRVVGLKQRITPTLVRMAEDYASERRAAGRSLPADLALVTGEGV